MPCTKASNPQRMASAVADKRGVESQSMTRIIRVLHGRTVAMGRPTRFHRGMPFRRRDMSPVGKLPAQRQIVPVYHRKERRKGVIARMDYGISAIVATYLF
jgi:hypothetical protein